jgi:hypothetical protein
LVFFGGFNYKYAAPTALKNQRYKIRLVPKGQLEISQPHCGWMQVKKINPS